MSKTVRIAGNPFPTEVAPGKPISYTDAEGYACQGYVWDRAPQGPAQGSNRYPYEGSGIWLWVIPEGERRAVRVQYTASGRNAGRAVEDTGRFVVRTMNGYRWSDEVAA